MHVVIRKYVASPEYIDEVRSTLDRLEATMRGLPGFVAYYFVETEDGLASITITEDEAGTSESMGHAASWIEEQTPNNAPGAPEITRGHTLISATR